MGVFTEKQPRVRDRQRHSRGFLARDTTEDSREGAERKEDSRELWKGLGPGRSGQETAEEMLCEEDGEEVSYATGMEASFLFFFLLKVEEEVVEGRAFSPSGLLFRLLALSGDISAGLSTSPC